MSRWLTPEEIQLKRERKRKLGLLLIPLLGVLLGVLVTFIINAL